MNERRADQISHAINSTTGFKTRRRVVWEVFEDAQLPAAFLLFRWAFIYAKKKNCCRLWFETLFSIEIMSTCGNSGRFQQMPLETAPKHFTLCRPQLQNIKLLRVNAPSRLPADDWHFLGKGDTDPNSFSRLSPSTSCQPPPPSGPFMCVFIILWWGVTGRYTLWMFPPVGAGHTEESWQLLCRE